jgi:hypothetical protein
MTEYNDEIVNQPLESEENNERCPEVRNIRSTSWPRELRSGVLQEMERSPVFNTGRGIVGERFLILNKSEYHSANVRGAGGSLVMRQARERYMRDGYRHTERGVQTRSPIRQSRSVSQSIIFPSDMADSRGRRERPHYDSCRSVDGAQLSSLQSRTHA